MLAATFGHRGSARNTERGRDMASGLTQGMGAACTSQGRSPTLPGGPSRAPSWVGRGPLPVRSPRPNTWPTESGGCAGHTVLLVEAVPSAGPEEAAAAVPATGDTLTSKAGSPPVVNKVGAQQAVSPMWRWGTHAVPLMGRQGSQGKAGAPGGTAGVQFFGATLPPGHPSLRPRTRRREMRRVRLGSALPLSGSRHGVL